MLPYLESGRFVYAEGTDFGYSNRTNDLWPYFGCEYLGDGQALGNVSSLVGRTGTLAHGMNLTYPWSTGPDSYVDEIGANGGTLFFLDQSNIGRAVCHTNGTWRTIFSSVVFGALGGQDDRAGLMAAYVRYLLTGMALTEQPPVASRPWLQVSPNPAPAGGAVRFRSGTAGTFTVFDAFGRRVGEWQGREATWSLPGVNAGTYFVRLTAAGVTVTRPLVVCR